MVIKDQKIPGNGPGRMRNGKKLAETGSDLCKTPENDYKEHAYNRKQI